MPSAQTDFGPHIVKIVGLAKLQTLSKVTGAPVAELIRRAIDVYLEQRKAEIKNA